MLYVKRGEDEKMNKINAGISKEATKYVKIEIFVFGVKMSGFEFNRKI